MHQAAGGPQGQGQLAQAQAVETGQPEALLEGGAGFRGFKGRAGQGREQQAGRAPGGCVAGAAVARVGGRQSPRPEHLGSVRLQQLLVEGITARALGDPEFAGAHIGNRQAPAQATPVRVPLTLARRTVQHHGAEPVVAAGGEHALLQHRAGGEHAGDLAPQQLTFRSCGFHLIAQGHAVAAAHQFAAIALGGVVGDAGHRHPADRPAALLAGEGELQQARGGEGVLEEALEEVAQAVEQQAFGVGCLELHVVAQHRRELLGVHQAVVVPGGQVGVSLPWALGRRRSRVFGRRLGWAGMGVLPPLAGTLGSLAQGLRIKRFPRLFC